MRGEVQMIYVKSNTQNDLPHNQLQLLVHAPAFKQVAIITVVTVPSTGAPENV